MSRGSPLEVNFIKVTGKGILFAALQLTLLRHLWVEYMRTYDPDLIVMGGQPRFDDQLVVAHARANEVAQSGH